MDQWGPLELWSTYPRWTISYLLHSTGCKDSMYERGVESESGAFSSMTRLQTLAWDMVGCNLLGETVCLYASCNDSLEVAVH